MKKFFLRQLGRFFGRKQWFLIRRDDKYIWCEGTGTWCKPGDSIGSSSNHRWFKKSEKLKAFEEFEKLIAMGIPCTLQEDCLILGHRIALWDYESMDQNFYGAATRRSVAKYVLTRNKGNFIIMGAALTFYFINEHTLLHRIGVASLVALAVWAICYSSSREYRSFQKELNTK